MSFVRYLYDEELISDYVYGSGRVVKKGIFGYLPQFMPEEEQGLSICEYFEDVDIYENYDSI